MLVYNYSGLTGEFLGSTEARKSPLEPGVYLIPANATDLAPPALQEKQAAVFHEGSWHVVDDRRGEAWYQPDGTEITIVDLGDPAQSGLLADKSQIVPPAPTQHDYENAIQELIDTTAQARNYADGNSCASYAGDTIIAQWGAEGSAFKVWRSQIWAYVYLQLHLVQTGQRSQPTIEELLAELPPIVWP